MPLVVLGATFVITYSMWVLWLDRPDIVSAVILIDFVVSWLAFLIDYVVRVALTPRGRRGEFFRANLVDLLSIALPMFRAFRVVALLRRVPYFATRSGAAVRTEVIAYAAMYAILFVYFTALATLDAERTAPDATITTFGDAIWWACVTIATVGYGDTYPVTPLGRVYAVVLMVGGVAILGTASAIVISFLNERILGRGGAHQPRADVPD